MIKVCGMREAENIRAVEALGVDLVGFIFYDKSSRYVGMLPSRAGNTPDYVAPSLAAGASPGRVGVFVDDMAQNIITRVYTFDLDYVQLHGAETPLFIDNLRATVDPDIHPGIKIIKTLSINSSKDFGRWRIYKNHVDMLLFDAKCATRGGSGEKFDWSLLDAYDGDIPFLLSGGIGPEDAAAVGAVSHPMFAGIDLNSRFETAPALKDVGRLSKFINEIRNAKQ